MGGQRDAWAHRWDVFLQGNPDDKIHWSLCTYLYIFICIYIFNVARRRRAAHVYAHLTPSTMYTYVYIHIIFFITGRQDSLVLDHELTMIVVFLTVMVAMILVRTLSQDIAHYNDAALLDEAKEESVVQCP